jgi:ribosomal protein L31
LGGLQFEASKAKKVSEIPSQQIRLPMVEHACHPSYTGSTNKRLMVQASPVRKHKILFEKQLKQKDPSGRPLT